MSDYIPLDQCKHGYLYKIHSRNLGLGVFNSKDNGFIGIRTKFSSRYLFTEFHWDTGIPYGTVKPERELEKIPDAIIIAEELDTIDDITKRSINFDKPTYQGGRGWFFTDTNEDCPMKYGSPQKYQQVKPVSLNNKELFNYLDEKLKLEN